MGEHAPGLSVNPREHSNSASIYTLDNSSKARGRERARAGVLGVAIAEQNNEKIKRGVNLPVASSLLNSAAVIRHMWGSRKDVWPPMHRP